MKIMWIVGIVIGIVLILIAAVKIGDMIFDRQVNKEIKEMFAGNRGKAPRVITEEDLEGLPEPVQRWLQEAKVIGKEEIKTVKLKQEGFFKTGPDKSWLPFTAEQYYTTENPAFIWHVSMKASPGINVAGRDKYYQGRGHMLIKLLSLITVADASGPEIDQGTLLRYLNETMWFPTAVLNDYIEWEAIDQNSARATMTYEGVSASAIFYFNEAGELINFKADRYMEMDGEYKLEEWVTPINEYKVMNGVKIPTSGEGVWKLASGEFPYIRLKVVDIEYNKEL